MRFPLAGEKTMSNTGKAILATVILSAGALAGCGPIGDAIAEQEERAAQLEQQRLREEQQRLEGLYAQGEGLARFELPMVDIQIMKEEFTLDPFELMGNEAKAEHLVLPVSQEYVDSVHVGQELESRFNTVGFLFDGEIASYVVTIDRLFTSGLNCLIDEGACSELTDEEYARLLELNATLGDYQETGDPEVLLRPGEESIAHLYTDSCSVVIQSKKDDFTLDLIELWESDTNRLEYGVELPRFMCDSLQPGDTIDRHFVGASLLFSQTPSGVTYRVLELTRNYPPGE